MTIELKDFKPNVLDWILSLFGKQRASIIPAGVTQLHSKYGPYVYAVVRCKKGSFWKALFASGQR